MTKSARQAMGAPAPRIIEAAGLIMSVIFAAVGLIFLVSGDAVLAFFNAISAAIGWVPGPAHADGFFRILACGYMYVVSLLAFLLWRRPFDRIPSLLLVNAKGASAFLSACFFLLDQPLLIYATNCVVDGSIAVQRANATGQGVRGLRGQRHE